MHTKLKMIGCGGHFKVVLDALLLNSHQSYQISLCDDALPLGSTVQGFLVDSNLSSLSAFIGLAHVSIGHNRIREQVFKRLRSSLNFLSIQHPSAVLSQSAIVGAGSFIAARAVLGPECQIGEGCIINHGAVVDHEVTVGAFSHIAPNSTLGGQVRIGKGVLVGSGAVILPGIEVGDGAIIAAGAVVVKDVKLNTTVKGVPAL